MKKIYKIIIMIIILFMLIILITIGIRKLAKSILKEDVYEKVDEMFSYLNDGKTYEFNMMFYENDYNKDNIEEKYKENMSYDEYQDIGYTQFVTSDDYLLPYYKLIKITEKRMQYIDSETVYVYVVVSKPDYEEYINEALNNESEGLGSFEDYFVNIMGSDSVEYVTDEQIITFNKIDNKWYPVYDTGLEAIVYCEYEEE